MHIRATWPRLLLRGCWRCVVACVRALHGFEVFDTAAFRPGIERPITRSYNDCCKALGPSCFKEAKAEPQGLSVCN